MIQKRGSRFLVIGVLAFGLLTASCGHNTVTQITVIVTATPAAAIQAQPTQAACDKQAVLLWLTTMRPLLGEYSALLTSMNAGTTTINAGLETAKLLQARVAATETPECMAVAQGDIMAAIALSRQGSETALLGDTDTATKLLQQSGTEMDAATAEANRVQALMQ